MSLGKPSKLAFIPAIFLGLIIGFSAADVQVSGLSDWTGSFDQSSVTRNANSGNLGIGYRNGTTGDNLIGFWRFDNAVAGTGGTVTDYSGNGNDGSTGGSVGTGINGVFSTSAYSFDGTEDYVTVPGIQVSNVSVSFWIRTTDTTSGASWWEAPWLLDKDLSGGGGNDWAATVNGGLVQWVNGDSTNGVDETLTSNTNISDGNWHHVVLTRNSGTGEKNIYIDGQQDATQSAYAGDISNTNDLYIASEKGTGSYLSADLDEMRLYDDALTQEDVQELYMSGGDGTFDGDYASSDKNILPSNEVLN